MPGCGSWLSSGRTMSTFDPVGLIGPARKGRWANPPSQAARAASRPRGPLKTTEPRRQSPRRARSSWVGRPPRMCSVHPPSAGAHSVVTCCSFESTIQPASAAGWPACKTPRGVTGNWSARCGANDRCITYAVLTKPTSNRDDPAGHRGGLSAFYRAGSGPGDVHSIHT